MATLQRSDLADLNVFMTILRHGGFRGAAAELGVTASALSHTMRKLEERLAVRLLNRTSRSVAPTQAGADLAARLAQSFEAIGGALDALEGYRGAAIGRLRVNLPRDASRLVVGPVLAEFTARHPQIELDLIIDDRPVDIVAGGFDAGIRYGTSVPKDMIAVALTKPLRWVVAGSPGYFAKHGRPAVPEELRRHRCVRMRIGDETIFPWELGDGDVMVSIDVPGTVIANETETQVAAGVAGIGLCYCLERRIERELREGLLQIVMPDWSSMGPPLAIYYPSRRQVPVGLRHLVALIRAANGLPRPAT